MADNQFKNAGQLERNENSALVNWLQKCCDYKITKLYDLGCGYGTWTCQLAEISDASQVYASDIDKKAEAHTRALLGDKAKSNIKKFDLIMSFAVLELMSAEENEERLREFKSKLASADGTILLMYNFYHILNLRWLIFAILGFGNAKKYHEQKRFTRNYLTFKEFAALCDAQGLYIKSWYAPRLFQYIPVSSKLLPIAALFQTFFLEIKVK